MSASIQKDTEEKVLSVGGDLSVLIVNHFKSKGHEAESLEDVFNKDSQKFPTFDTIDAEFEELKEDD
jgi:hypothetical protein